MAGGALVVVDQTRPVLDHPGDGSGIEGPQPVPPHEGGDETGEEVLGLGVTLHLVLEVHGDLEEVRKLRVQLGQQVIDGTFPVEHHLHVQGNRLRLQ